MRQITVRDIVKTMRDWAPENWAEGFDNPGLLAGNMDAAVTGVYIALDARVRTVRRAKEAGCNLVITHHPLFLSGGVKCFCENSGNGDIDTVIECVKTGTALYAAHTNLDRASGGVNDCLREALGWLDAGVLSDDYDCGDENMPRGLARLARLPRVITLREAAEHTARCLGISNAEYVGDDEMPVSVAALCGGSGGSMIEEALHAGAQLLVTGEAKHHERVAAQEAGLGLIVAGHAETEQVVLPKVAASLQTALDAVQCKLPVIYEKDSAVTRRTL